MELLDKTCSYSLHSIHQEQAHFMSHRKLMFSHMHDWKRFWICNKRVSRYEGKLLKTNVVKSERSVPLFLIALVEFFRSEQEAFLRRGFQVEGGVFRVDCDDLGFFAYFVWLKFGCLIFDLLKNRFVWVEMRFLNFDFSFSLALLKWFLHWRCIFFLLLC